MCGIVGYLGKKKKAIELGLNSIVIELSENISEKDSLQLRSGSF